MPARWKTWTAIVLGLIAAGYFLLDFGFQLGKKAGYTNYDVDYKQWLIKETEALEELVKQGDSKDIQVQAARVAKLTSALGDKERFFLILTQAEQGDDAN